MFNRVREVTRILTPGAALKEVYQDTGSIQEVLKPVKHEEQVLISQIVI